MYLGLTLALSRNRGSPMDWTPSALGASLALWLDAADASTITLNGSTVSQWNDRSGNGRNVSQANASLQPTYSATGMLGRPTLDWGSAINNRGLRNDAVSNFNPTRYFIVADYDGADPFDEFVGLVSHNVTVNTDVIVTNSPGVNWFAGDYFHNGNLTATNVALPTISSPFVLATDFAQTAGRTSLFIGHDRFLAFPRGWRGKISEVIAINFVPTTQERQRIEGYLAWKWGLEANLPAGHPFKNTPPTL